MNRPNWTEYALALAQTAAFRSEDPWLKVGAVVLRSDRSVASIGYNGAPSNVELDWNDREARRPYVIHAEANALRYVTPPDTRGGLLAVTHRPCMNCLPLISAYGIKEVFYLKEINQEIYPPDRLNQIADRLGIQVKRHEGEINA
jgi:dCMP deaminase